MRRIRPRSWTVRGRGYDGRLLRSAMLDAFDAQEHLVRVRVERTEASDSPWICRSDSHGRGLSTVYRGLSSIFALIPIDIPEVPKATAWGDTSMRDETFPIDLSALQPLKLDPAVASLSDTQKATLKHNIQLCRDAIVFFTALAGAKGLSGHTGGAYDTVPEVMILRAFIAHGTPIVPIIYDEAGHRVATQYLLSVLNGAMPAERLLHYREYASGLPGHPEKGLTPGLEFSSGRLGHLWSFCNGVAMANPGKAVVLLGSDGSQMEGDDAEAARLAVAKRLNIKVLVDDNNVTISGHPQEYLDEYDLTRTLAGHGLQTATTMGEDLDALFIDLCRAFSDPLRHERSGPDRERAGVRQRSGGLLRLTPYPQEAPGSIRAGRHHGARQLFDGRRFRLLQRQAGHLCHFQRLPRDGHQRDHDGAAELLERPRAL